MVTAEPPDVALGILREQRPGAATDLVDVVDLPGGVMQKRHRRGLHEQIGGSNPGKSPHPEPIEAYQQNCRRLPERNATQIAAMKALFCEG
jgi:hypothetical protein